MLFQVPGAVLFWLLGVVLFLFRVERVLGSAVPGAKSRNSPTPGTWTSATPSTRNSTTKHPYTKYPEHRNSAAPSTRNIAAPSLHQPPGTALHKAHAEQRCTKHPDTTLSSTTPGVVLGVVPCSALCRGAGVVVVRVPGVSACPGTGCRAVPGVMWGCSPLSMV